MMDATRRRRELVDHYVRTGESDILCSEWPGEHALTRMNAARVDRRSALVRAVKNLARQGTIPTTDVGALVRRSHDGVRRMVRGLFPPAEQAPTFDLLVRSIVVVTSDTVERLIMDQSFDRTAWDLANLYLGSIDAPLLSPTAPAIAGMNEGTMSYVTPADLLSATPFADVIVHESAHVFHNCKRRDAGLKMTRRREWLLDIEIGKRETFAYSCEAYSRILEQSGTKADRVRLASEYAKDLDVSDERVDSEEVASIVKEAAEARNGWRGILSNCSQRKRTD